MGIALKSIVKIVLQTVPDIRTEADCLIELNRSRVPKMPHANVVYRFRKNINVALVNLPCHIAETSWDRVTMYSYSTRHTPASKNECVHTKS